MSNILVIGSGLIGLTTAYFLRQREHEVTVVDRAEGPGQETSFANAGLLTASMPEPWNAPGCWRVLLGSIGRSDAPLQLRLRTLPALAEWGVGFLRNSAQARFERNALSNLRLALHSLRVMKALREETGIEYGRTARGTLKVFRDELSMDRAAVWAHRFSAEGLAYRRLSARETVQLEPALEPIEAKLAGGIHYQVDETGDAHRFCIALAAHLEEQGVRFRFRTEVPSLNLHAGKMAGVVCGGTELVADEYVLAAGSYSTTLLRGIGVKLPVQPAKGYSITLECPASPRSLGIPVVDDGFHAAVVPFGRTIRVAGTAEFAGYDRSFTPARIENLLRLLKEVLPETPCDLSTAKPWCGLRPMSVDGVPIIGPSPVANLWVNTGHGHLGWTMAASSGQLLGDLMCGDAPSVEAASYAMTRFAASPPEAYTPLTRVSVG